MREKQIVKEILEEIDRCVRSVCPDDLKEFVEKIREIAGGRKHRIFCDGAGRSRLQAEGFAMRLAQMGLNVHMVGETTAPALRAGDLLLICSGSGETGNLLEHGKLAKQTGAVLVTITANRESALGKLSDQCIVINASVKDRESDYSVQPMGSLFEQSSGILFDLTVLMLMDRLGLSGRELFQNHSNLE